MRIEFNIKKTTFLINKKFYFNKKQKSKLVKKSPRDILQQDSSIKTNKRYYKLQYWYKNAAEYL